ncbi:agmatine/peptidylarginine deiminase [Undibacterium rugosum]|uniref:Agmatine deiminase family protein n=1 Tax=Undibacterium rugosum TaxID=2762291 RepID=A0A923I4G4_9BURK|nr:agmatine deiminase family protein [Undibacterium rugosum]MBC3935904.1 agmatine deiminase family protein [Undibacterium rugosum]MBR7779313.1 agmatine deiminase family protein [Undibacterium rugosum]
MHEMENTKKYSRRDFVKLASAGVTGVAMSGMTGNVLAQITTATSGIYFVPDENLPHTRTWMAWPSSTSIWGSLLTGIQADIALLARTIAKYEPVYMVANGSSNASVAKSKIGTTVFPVTIIPTIPNDDCWMRDLGAIFRKDGAGGLNCFGLNFNGWGNKQTHAKDALVAKSMASYLGLNFTASTVVGEGGGVVEDGDGTLLANESCWVNSNRNPGMSRNQIEAELLKQYGASKMIWCKGVIGQDITDDHCDATVQFTQPGTVVVHVPDPSNTDAFAANAAQWLQTLSTSTDAKGRAFNIIKLQAPKATSKTMLASYINYCVTNNAVINVAIGAICNDPAKDVTVKAQLAAAYPGRTVEMLKLPTLYGQGGGGIHCVTQQQPIP